MKLIWKIYYGDGSSFSNLDGEPSLAPGLNVQIIRINNGTLHSKDYYLYHKDNGWFGVMGEISCLDQIINTSKIVTVKAGRTIGNQEFHDLLLTATYDEAFED